MFKVDLVSLESERQKAFAVFVKAKTALQLSVDKALKLREQNFKKADELEVEKITLLSEADAVKDHIDKVLKSIQEIDKVIG